MNLNHTFPTAVSDVSFVALPGCGRLLSPNAPRSPQALPNKRLPQTACLLRARRCRALAVRTAAAEARVIQRMRGPAEG